MSAERVQKLLARAGVAARRKAEELIREGRVTVNGQVAELGAKADPERDAVKVDGKRIQFERSRKYVLLNKPRGVLTTLSDPEGRPTVIALLPPALRKALVPVGRLDYHTEGLLLLTDDGELAQRVSHPRYGCRKIYEAKVRGIPEERDLARLRQGIVLDGQRTSPCTIEPIRATRPRGGEGGNAWLRIELGEGRSRQIREMFFRIGHPVQKLKRVAIGPLVDVELSAGQWRELSERELAALRRATAREKPRPPRSGAPPKRPRGRGGRGSGRA